MITVLTVGLFALSCAFMRSGQRARAKAKEVLAVAHEKNLQTLAMLDDAVASYKAAEAFSVRGLAAFRAATRAIGGTTEPEKRLDS